MKMPTGKLYVPNDNDRMTLVIGLKLDVPLKRIAREIGVSVQTLANHYGDVIAEAELKPGRKRFEPTEQQQRIVKVAAAGGMPHEDIASLIGCSKATLEKYFHKELSLGASQAHFQVIGNLLKMATGPIEQKNTLSAAIWWTKARMGWKDTSRVESTDGEGKPLNGGGQVVIMLPDNGRGDSNLPTVPYEPYEEEPGRTNDMGSGFPDDENS